MHIHIRNIVQNVTSASASSSVSTSKTSILVRLGDKDVDGSDLQAFAALAWAAESTCHFLWCPGIVWQKATYDVPFFLFFTILNTVACTSTSNTSIHGGGASTNCPIWNFCSTSALILPLHKLVVVFRPVAPYIFHQPWNYIITFLVRKLDPECHSMYITMITWFCMWVPHLQGGACHIKCFGYKYYM